MRNSKLYSILEYFDKYEQNRLRKFLQSPYFNRNEALVGIFEQLVGFINSGKEGDLEKEDIWSSINGKVKFDDVLFRKNCSDLLKLIESFLAQQVYEENPIHKANYLIEAVGKRKMEPLYNSTKKSAKRLSEKQLYHNGDFYLYQYQVERNFYDMITLEHDRTVKRNVEAVLDNLDRFYLSEKLRYSCSVFSQTSMVSHEYKLLFIDEIIQHINKYGYKDVPPVAIYFQIYLTQIESDKTEHYFKLMKLLNEFGDNFPKNESEFIYTTALNYCVRKLNQGSRKFLEEYFNVFVILLKKELLLVDGELSPWHFRNIVSIALRLGKFSWTEEFIHSYKVYLPKSMRDNAVSFNTAMLYFFQKKHDKVVELLQRVEYEEFTYNLNSKSMLLQTYYETDEIEPLYSIMDSFRTYLNRHKEFSANKRIHFTNLIKFTKKLTKIMPGDQKAIEKLKAEVTKAEEKGIASITWLKEKIAELE